MAKIKRKPHRHFDPQPIVMTDEMVKDANDMEANVIRDLTQIRFDADVSTVELGEAIGVHYRTISKYENMKQTPTLYTLCTMAAALGVKIKVVQEG